MHKHVLLEEKLWGGPTDVCKKNILFKNVHTCTSQSGREVPQKQAMGFSSGPSRGLADLLGHSFLGSTQCPPRTTMHTVAHVLDVDPDHLSGPDLFQCVEDHLAAHDKTSSVDVAAGHETSGEATATISSSIAGLVGPARVTLDRATCQGQLKFSQVCPMWWDNEGCDACSDMGLVSM